jgi:porphobilinogen synthase
MPFPLTRLRRLRSHPTLRRMVRETQLSVDDLIAPLFVCSGQSVRQPIESLPGQSRLSPDLVAEECRRLAGLGVPAVLLFGIPDKKDSTGSTAWRPDGVVPDAIEAIRKACRDLIVIADVCLCEYTDTGHCGVVRRSGDSGDVDNDATLPLLVNAALCYARAGAQVVAPSDMMDGRVGAIRRGLDAGGLASTVIMSYAAKYASSYYGPFRDAADCAPQFGDRRGYQMDPANADEALREVAEDIAEGADIVMVKPAINYLDLVWRVKQRFGLPTAAYHVSGEYAMIEAACERGWLDRRLAATEATVAIKRAGADLIATYYAGQLAEWLRKG